MIFEAKPSGWKPWHYIRTWINNYTVPYGQFPKTYLPASKFWVQSLALHCEIPVPWTTFTDPFTAFLYAGGASGSLVGSVLGIQAYNQNLGQGRRVAYGIGSPSPALTTGYCIGDKYKENVYFRLSLDATAAPGIGNIVNADFYSDVFQRSRLKRIYLYHGEIRKIQYQEDISSNQSKKTVFIFLDLDEETPEQSKIVLVDENIKVYKKDGTIVDFKIKEVKDKWLVVAETNRDSSSVSSGDFYVFDRPVCIEDPLMISGYWRGTETESGFHENSQLGAHVTNYSCPNDSVDIVGAYVWKNSDGLVSHTSYESPLNFEGDGEWCWNYKDKTSEIYGKEEKRWKEVISFSNVSSETVGDVSVPITMLKEFEIASDEDVASWEEDSDNKYLRVELNDGGGVFKQNWHSPILKKCWAKQNNKYFKILNQPIGNVIDISIKDVLGTTTINLDEKITIFNQYAWMIIEHIMGKQNDEIFGGIIKSFEDKSDGTTTIVVSQEPMSVGTFGSSSFSFNPSYLDNQNSFYNRFSLNPHESIINPPMIYGYDKYRGSILYRKGIDEVMGEIKAINIDERPSNFPNTYDLSITIKKKAEDMSIGQSVYVSFGEKFKRPGRFQGSIIATFKEGISGGSPSVCIDAKWISSPIIYFLDQSEIIGICGGRYWGGMGPGNPQSETNNNFFVTTPYGGFGSSSLYHDILQEGWISYLDPYSGKITLRRGSLNFKEFPKKTEIFFGGNVESVVTSDHPFKLDASKERLKAISFEIPEGKYGEIITVGVKNKDNIYGNICSGNGKVDLQPFRKQNITKEASDYKFEGFYSSPVYSYLRSERSCFQKGNTIDIGLDPKQSSPLYINGGVVSNAKLQYIKNNQVLEGGNYFDIMRAVDGEDFFIYGNSVGEFSVNGKLNNSSEELNTWITPNAVFIAGSANESLFWGCPMAKNLDGENRHPLMVLPGSVYLSSVYHKTSNRIFIFARCYQSVSQEYIGCLSIPVNALNYNTYRCFNTKTEIFDFLFRPLSLPKQNIEDKYRSYSEVTLIKDMPKEEKKTSLDNFVRVIGRGDVRCQIPSSEDINFTSPFCLNDGTIGILYDSQFGIGLLFSRNGTVWRRSPIIVARNAICPKFIDENVICYITSSGIEAKINIGADINSLIKIGEMNSSEGNYNELREKIQTRFDSFKRVSIGSGPIESQGLSGYTTIDGIHKVFFYNQSNVISSIEDDGSGLIWKIADNF